MGNGNFFIADKAAWFWGQLLTL